MPRDWTSKADVAAQLERAAQFTAASTDRQYRLVAGAWADGDDVESPLEAIFLIWFLAMSRVYGSHAQITRQVEVDAGGRRYRLDFVLCHDPVAARMMDGHAFHERTPEQVAHRNERDRALQRDGWRVFHFSWSELTQRPEQCLLDLLEYFNAQVTQAIIDKVGRR
jgi:very-short-patch-repair endonuclease